MLRRWLMARSKAAHPELIPTACLLWGHARNNDLVSARGGRGCYIAGNPCVRKGCPTEDHLWKTTSRGPQPPGTWAEECRVPGCKATRFFRVPFGPGMGGFSHV